MDKIGEKIGFLAFFFTMMSISSSPHPLLLALCYVIHEAGHLIVAKVARVPFKKLRVGSFRLTLSYDCLGVSYKRELLVCVGGVLFNLLATLVALPFSLKGIEGASFFVSCNLWLALMNIYPVSTLDGGRIFKCVFMILFTEKTAERLCRVVSFLFAFLLWLCAVYLQMVFNSNVSLFFISVFLLIELCFSK